METLTIPEVIKCRTLSDDPQYFGGYLNMARLNIFNISNHIAKEFDLPLLAEEGHLKNSFLCKKEHNKVNWNHVYSRTKRFLAVLKVFDAETLPKEEQKTINWEGKDFASMSDILKIVFGELQEFRNDYSHYYSTEKGTIRKTAVSAEMALFLTTNFRRAIEYTKERFKGVLNDEDYQLVASKKVLEANSTITTEGLVFLISMFLEREYAFRFIGIITGLKGTQNNSFIATREVLMAFCLKLPHDRFQSDNPRQAFSLDLINELNRCPKVLYNAITEEGKQKLRSIPGELENKNLHDNNTKKEAKIEAEAYELYIESLTRQIRYSNRFPDFALKFIDETDIFSEFRFQIDLGKLLVDEYLKFFNGEHVQRRIVENAKAFGKLIDFNDEAKVMTRIGNGHFSKRFEQFAPFYNTEDNKIGISRHHVTAKLGPDSKGEPEKKLLQPLPEAFLSLHELPKVILLDYLQKGEPEKLINDFILINNSKLMNMSFIEAVKTQLPPEWDEFQRRTGSKNEMPYNEKTLAYLLQRKQILNKILAEFQLNDKQIPGRILDYWLNIADVEEERAVSDRIKSIKRDCMSRLRALGKFKIDRNRNKIPKIGEMATFLAKDIVDMVVSEGKKHKITSFYYEKMQDCLSLFADPLKRQLFIHIITNELRLNDSGGHPFLFKLNMRQINCTSDFYEIYLQEKGHKMVPEKNLKTGKVVNTDHSWMALTFYKLEFNDKVDKLMTVVKLPLNKLNLPFTLRQLNAKTTYTLEQWLKNLTLGKKPDDGKHPVNLPTNLFDEKLSDLLRQDLDNNKIAYRPYANWNELFKIWWISRNDSLQRFYNAEREYHIFNEKVNFYPNRKENFADYYQHAVKVAFQKKRNERIIEQRINKYLPDILFEQVEKTFKHTIAETEKEIRILQEEDRIMLLMLEGLMEDGNKQQLKLSEIKTLQNATINIRQLVPGKLSFDDSGEAIKDSTNPEIVRTVSVSIKRIEYNLLPKYVADGRLPELFEYFPDEEIQMERLKTEFDTYNKVRQVVLDLSFKLEKMIIEKGHKDRINQLCTGATGELLTGNICHHTYLTWLKDKEMIDNETFIFMNMVQHCFSHNQYPQKKTMERIINHWEPDRFALTIAATYNQKIAGILEDIGTFPFIRSRKTMPDVV